jgi:hypothetical protein
MFMHRASHSLAHEQPYYGLPEGTSTIPMVVIGPPDVWFLEWQQGLQSHPLLVGKVIAMLTPNLPVLRIRPSKPTQVRAGRLTLFFFRYRNPARGRLAARLCMRRVWGGEAYSRSVR